MRDRMARNTTALEIRNEEGRCVQCVRAYGDDGRTCGEMGSRGAAAEEQEEIKDEGDLRIRVCGRIAGRRYITTD